MSKKQIYSGTEYKQFISWAFALGMLYMLSLHNYLLFHSLVEILSIVVAYMLFLVVWKAKSHIENEALIFIGIAYIFVGTLDLLHTLAYKGMGVFPGFDANLPTQLWIASRYLESGSLLIIASYFAVKKTSKVLKPENNSYFKVFSFYAGITVLTTFSIFYSGNFPDCYIEGSGLTEFKIISEYIISFMFFSSFLIFYSKKENYDNYVLKMLLISVLFSIFAELAFTYYISVYGLSNAIGHFFKLISFYLIYKAVVETGIKRPYDILFRELKLSEEAYKKHSQILNQVSEAVIFADMDGYIKGWNPGGEKLFGYRENDALGKHMSMLCPGGENCMEFEGIKQKLESHRTIDKIQFEHQMKKRSGDTFSALCFFSLFRDEDESPSGIINYVLDISDRKEAENKLKQYAYRLAELNESKDVLTDILRHDLLNPAGVIRGYTELLLSNESDPGKISMLTKIYDNNETLIKLVVNASEFAKLDSFENIDMEALDLNGLIVNAIENVEHITRKKGMEVEFTSRKKHRITANPIVGEVFVNLLSNAAKYSPAGEKIKVEIEDSEAFWKVKVVDRGNGVPLEERENIFHRMVRNTKHCNIKGSGFGLAIVKKIVELHEGKVGVEDNPEGKGAVFWVTMRKAESIRS